MTVPNRGPGTIVAMACVTSSNSRSQSVTTRRRPRSQAPAHPAAGLVVGERQRRRNVVSCLDASPRCHRRFSTFSRRSVPQAPNSLTCQHKRVAPCEVVWLDVPAMTRRQSTMSSTLLFYIRGERCLSLSDSIYDRPCNPRRAFVDQKLAFAAGAH